MITFSCKFHEYQCFFGRPKIIKVKPSPRTQKKKNVHILLVMILSQTHCNILVFLHIRISLIKGERDRDPVLANSCVTK